MAFKHIIFDCDGVLVDSEPLSMEIDRQILAENGIDMSLRDLGSQFIGLTFAALIAKIEKDHGVKLPDGVTAEKDRRLLALYKSALRAAPGAHAALEAIELPKSVASNSPRHRVEAAFRIVNLEHHFGGRITTFEDVARGKPAPDIYLLAARRASCEPGECLVVEDSKAGVASAGEAGCHVIGYTGLEHDPVAAASTLRKHGARQVVNAHDDLPAAIAAIGSL